ncbi:MULTISPECIES: hypothetical protein [unclassified Streptomyces]|uniref:hypothetical protein n=1 Tax=unclassified Streptomyces TaxID=2593676 RepID=UPI002E289CA8|nr:hypothetical protein [Streptomyces sp. NBC_01429]
MTPELTQYEERPAEPVERKRGGAEKIGNLEVWARSAPIRLAGYEDDLAEPHILPGVD